MMTRSTALGMLSVGNTGEEILQILDVIVEDITQENINDCAEYFASISAWSVFSEWYLEGAIIPLFLYSYIQDYAFFILKKVL